MNVADTTVQATASGTVPGSPLADLLYQYVQTRFVRLSLEDLQAQGIGAQCVDCTEAARPQTWADDVALLLPICSADALEDFIQRAVPILDMRSRQVGVELNFDAGKTEVLLSVRGKRSLSTKRRLLGADCPVVPVQLIGGRKVDVRLVESYVHLGNTVTHAAACLEDVQHKTRAASIVLQKLQRSLLRNTELTPQEKSSLVDALVLGKVKYGAGLWAPRTNAERAAVHSALSRPWRSACRPICGFSSKFLDETEICAALGCLKSTECLAIEQARQLCTALDCGPGYLWFCLLQAPLWLQQALASVRMVASALSMNWPLGDPRTAEQLHSLRQHASSMRRALPRYRRHCIESRRLLTPLVGQKAANIAAFEQAGGIIVLIPLEPPGAYQCELCLKRFSAQSSLASHKATVHKHAAEVSAARGSACLVCGQEWWTTHRLKEHLRRSSVCRHTYCGADLPNADPCEVVGSKSDRAWRPPTTTTGPVPFWATLRPPAPVVVRTGLDRDICHEVRRSFDKLLSRFADCDATQWAQSAFAWVRDHHWHNSWVPSGHAALTLLQILTDIAERVGQDGLEPPAVLHRGAVTALRQNRLWWISFR